jgi:hypothetical protein
MENGNSRIPEQKLAAKIVPLCFSVSQCFLVGVLQPSVQNLSLRYLSPESQRMVTITACCSFLG